MRMELLLLLFVVVVVVAAVAAVVVLPAVALVDFCNKYSIVYPFHIMH
jgi:hypothetical protein